MNKILGNLLFLMSAPIFALTTAGVNQSWFYPGDQITLTLSSDENQVSFPSIESIVENRVLYTSNSQKMSVINSQQSKKSSQSYVFKPSKSLTIPSYTLITDTGKQSTQPIEITLRKLTQAKSGDDHILQIEIDKKSFFLGDEITLKVVFKVKKELSKDNQVSIAIPEIKDLLFIKNNKTVRSADQDYNIHTLSYKLSANDFGTFTIPGVVASIGHQNSNIFSNFSAVGQTQQIKKIYSNSLTIKVNPLPDSLRVFGILNIQATIEKTQVEPGDAVNLVVSIHGKGNFEDIEKFDLDIENVTIYTDEPEFSHNQWQQKFALVAEQDFVIPSLTLDYFDKTLQDKKRIITKPISVQINTQKPVLIASQKVDQKLLHISRNTSTNNLKYYYLLLGIFIGALVTALVVLFKNKTPNKDRNLINQIKLARGDKALFDLLLPLNMAELESVLQMLEANIYKNSQHKIRKKDIINAIKFERKTH